MSTLRVRLSDRARDGLVVVAFMAAVIVLWLVWFWLLPVEWTPPRVG